SRLTTDTSEGSRDAYCVSSETTPSSTTTYALLPSATLSSTPVIVTCCGAFQLSGVNVSCAGDATPSAILFDVTLTVTFDAGCESRLTVNVASPCASPRRAGPRGPGCCRQPSHRRR